ncbi:MAG: response regulator transcription factor [Giesbergeria sp.]|nr:response regulator transcription factor [Giesbergeria sp.]
MFNEPLAPQAPCEPAISVALVEDEIGTRERLVRALGQTSRLCLAHAAGTAQELLDWLANNSVDVLLVDLGLPDLPGLEVIRRARAMSPGTEIMVITLFGDEANMMRAFEAGARGYLLKDGTEDDLARHVLNLHAGGSPMTPIIARQLLARLAPAPTPPSTAPLESTGRYDGLTNREHDILAKLSRGYTYIEVAQLLEIAPSTVQSHVKNIYSKLAVHSKAEAIFEARQLGLL